MNKTQLTQLLGMIRYEFKMHWRRRALLVLMLTTVFVITTGAFLISSEEVREKFINDYAQAKDVAPQEVMTLLIVLMSWFTVGSIFAFVLPITVADTIPLDRQMGTKELLDSLPISPATYLLGKILGAWVALLSSCFFMMISTAVIWRIIVGSYQIGPYLMVWLIGALSLVFLNGGLGVLLPATQPTRRRAIALVIAVLFSIPILLGRDFTLTGEMNFWDFISPMRVSILMYYSTSATNQATHELVLGVAVGLAELVVLAILIWAWLRWNEQKAY